LEGFRTLNDSKELCFVVIEDIDCIFKNRKEGDTMKNHITMQCLLNCLDGFNNQEGIILFLTTNYPEVLDSALTRSGRIDCNIELTFLNKQQANDMFESFFNDKNDIFENLWESVKSHNIPPSTFLDFLFSNRKANDIMDKIPNLIKVINKKDKINMYI
jgi:ATP-dependent 26S proteasome regulatory subunit